MFVQCALCVIHPSLLLMNDWIYNEGSVIYLIPVSIIPSLSSDKNRMFGIQRLCKRNQLDLHNAILVDHVRCVRLTRVSSAVCKQSQPWFLQLVTCKMWDWNQLVGASREDYSDQDERGYFRQSVLDRQDFIELAEVRNELGINLTSFSKGLLHDVSYC